MISYGHWTHLAHFNQLKIMALASRHFHQTAFWVLLACWAGGKKEEAEANSPTEEEWPGNGRPPMMVGPKK
jgi:hypothetical protein